MMEIIPGVEWMSLIPKSLTIGSTQTAWPGDVTAPIAMVDTGGGPVFLSDPKWIRLQFPVAPVDTMPVVGFLVNSMHMCKRRCNCGIRKYGHNG